MFITIQMVRGIYVYQVHDGRIEWAAVICFPGYEPFYNHYTNKIDRDWKLDARFRISPWFDSGRCTTPIDNPL